MSRKEPEICAALFIYLRLTLLFPFWWIFSCICFFVVVVVVVDGDDPLLPLNCMAGEIVYMTVVMQASTLRTTLCCWSFICTNTRHNGFCFKLNQGMSFIKFVRWWNWILWMSMTRIQQNVAFKDETNYENNHIFCRRNYSTVYLVILWKVDRDFLDSVKVNGALIWGN
jgi:hypothetical protein